MFANFVVVFLFFGMVFTHADVDSPQSKDKISYMRSKSSQPATVQGYVLDRQFTDNMVCLGNGDIATYASSYGACKWSQDVNKGIIYNSNKQVVTKIENNTLYYTETYYGEPFDCTGEPFATYEKSRFVGCKEYSRTDSELWQYVEDNEPWKSSTKGVVEK